MNESRLVSYLSVFLAATGTLSIVLAAGCAKEPDAKQQQELMVLCGSSFVQPAEQLCSEFREKTGIVMTSTAAGSEDFLPLVKTGQKGDILI